MKKIVDANGLSCPEPVLRLKQVIDGADEIEVFVDSQVCVENCSRFAKAKGFGVSVAGGSGQYTMTLTKNRTVEYLATFHTHYGANRFHKHCGKNLITAKMSPVPRELSSSCGVCVRFEAAHVPIMAEHEDMEQCYIIDENGAYIQAEGQ